MNDNEQVKKKNTKKWLIIAALVAIVVAAIAGIGIWAYLTDTESVSNVFTVGKVDITLTEPSWNANNAKNITAKMKLAKDPTVKNVGANDAYVYLKVKVPKVKLKDGDTLKVPLFTYQVNSGWSELTEKVVEEDSYIEKVYYYNQNDGILAVNSETPALFNEVQVANITSDTTYTTVEGETKRLAEDTNYKLEQAIDINAYAIQVNNLPQGRQTVQKAYDVVLGNEEDVPVTKIGNKTVDQILAEEGYTGLYGKQVKYSGLDESTTWRVFYVAGENDEFGQEKGTIYLKADQIGSTTLGTWERGTYTANSYNAEKTLVGEVNPEWYAARKDETWNENEKAAAYLCDPSVEMWRGKVVDKTDENIKWIMGAPSTEMYMKSYSQYKNNNYDSGYDSTPTPGYKYKTTGDYDTFIEGAIDTSSEMYKNTNQNWWIASPASEHSAHVCLVYGDVGGLDTNGLASLYGVCPVVCLKSGVQLELVD